MRGGEEGGGGVVLDLLVCSYRHVPGKLPPPLGINLSWEDQSHLDLSVRPLREGKLSEDPPK